MNAWDELTTRLEAMADRRAGRRAAQRFVVVKAAPLMIEELHGDLVLEAGDPDFEISAAVIEAAPARGAVVVVQPVVGSGSAQWIATGVVP